MTENEKNRLDEAKKALNAAYDSLRRKVSSEQEKESVNRAQASMERFLRILRTQIDSYDVSISFADKANHIELAPDDAVAKAQALLSDFVRCRARHKAEELDFQIGYLTQAIIHLISARNEISLEKLDAK